MTAGKGYGAPTTNTFQSLAADSDAEDEPAHAPSIGDRPSASEMDFLNLFAHQVQKGRRLSEKTRARKILGDKSPVAVAVTSSSGLNSDAVKDGSDAHSAKG